MKSLTLKLFEFYALQVELNGSRNQSSGEAGLLNQKLSLVAKYWINQLSTSVTDEIKQLDTLRDELIKKWGKEDANGAISISMTVESEDGSTPNPNFESFTKELNDLLNQEKEFNYHPVKLEVLANVESTENYPIFFKFVEA